jgi:predicted lipid-binding transport protein (Tim44 family)
MTARAMPAEFDSAAFLREAKLNFIRLQDANDRGDLSTLREVTTGGMFEAILADLQPQQRRAQHTDVVNLDANLLEVATQGGKQCVSVRFYGTVREDGGEAARFQEVWHLQKPVSGGSGWVLAGIQQVS